MVTDAFRSSYVSFSVVVTLRVCVPFPPLVGETVTHDVLALTLAVHAALVVNDTVAVPPVCYMTGWLEVISIFVFSGSGVGVGVISSLLSDLQLHPIQTRAKIRKGMNFFINKGIFEYINLVSSSEESYKDTLLIHKLKTIHT